MKNLFILFLMGLLLSFSVLAVNTPEYNTAGTEEYDWELDGRGIFNSQIDINTFSKSFTATKYMPLFSDLDNDNLTEVIVLDSDSVFVYNNKELDFQSSIDLGSAFAVVSNVLTFDIDGDGFREIVFHDLTNQKIHILNYSKAEGLQLQVDISATGNGATMIGCREPNECIIMLDSNYEIYTYGSYQAENTMASFDSTQLTSGATILFSEMVASSNGMAICLPRLANIPSVDFDNDGVKEFGVAFATAKDSSNTVTYRVRWLNNLTTDLSIDDGDLVTDRTTSCTGENGLSNYITSPIAGDTYSYPNMETYIGAVTDTNDFRIFVFKADGTKIDSYPHLVEGSGIIISNPMLGNFFAESGVVDVCVLGYDESNEEIDLVCGTDDIAGSDTAELEFSTESLFNISTDINKLSNVAHATQMSNNPTDGVDLNEIISAYGVFELDYSGLDNVLNRIWQNPSGEAVVYAVDIEDFGSDDIIAMTDTNLFYYDDKQSKEAPTLTSVSYNPCIIDSVLQLNTTLQITITSTDNNPPVIGQDPVNIDVSVYDGTTNELNGAVDSVASGSSNSFVFNMNQTITAGIITMATDDDFSPDIDTQTQTFTVANTGIEFGDSECTTDYVAIAEEEAEEIVGGEINETSNVGSQALGLLSGTGLGGFLNSLLIMGFIAFVFIFAPHLFGKEASHVEPKLIFSALILVETLLLFFFTALGTIPVGVTISLVVIAIIPLGLWVRNMITGANSGGG